MVEGLWEATREYISRSGVQPRSLEQHLLPSGAWNRNMYYTNFEVSRFDFWRSEAYRDFWSWIEASMGVYLHRWGDAPVHLLAVGLLLHPHQILSFSAVPYWHQYYVNLA